MIFVREHLTSKYGGGVMIFVREHLTNKLWWRGNDIC